jgi:VWFA-related protein
MTKPFFGKSFTFISTILLLCGLTNAQPPRGGQDNKVRTVTIPISIFSKSELREKKQEEFLEAGNVTVREDGDEQTILSIRDVGSTPLALAIMIQDDLSSSFNLEIKRLGEFIRRLPRGSRVMVVYLRGGTVQVRQRFTEDLEKAANSLRIVSGNFSFGPTSPFDAVSEALERFDALPSGRRAILLISDGLDLSRGVESSSPGQSIDLDQAILKAQRRSVAVYSIFSTTNFTENRNSTLILNGQGSLERISEETGGRAFFQGTSSPVSFDPFYKELNLALSRQFALTYLSTHMKKGYHKVQVISTNPEVKIQHPKGYYYR